MKNPMYLEEINTETNIAETDSDSEECDYLFSDCFTGVSDGFNMCVSEAPISYYRAGVIYATEKELSLNIAAATTLQAYRIKSTHPSIYYLLLSNKHTDTW